MAEAKPVCPFAGALGKGPSNATGAGDAQEPSDAAALRVLLTAQYADPAAIYGGLFSANRAGRDWVLTTAPHARLTLKPPTDTQPKPPWLAQLAALKSALAVRDQLLTSLTVQCSAQCTSAVLDTVPTALHGAAIAELRVVPVPRQSSPQHQRHKHTYSDEGSDWDSESESEVDSMSYSGQESETDSEHPSLPGTQAITHFLQLTASAFHHLSALHIACHCTLPHPNHLPHLTQLSFQISSQGFQYDDDVDSLLESAGPLMSQITTLSVHVSDHTWRISWDGLFTQPSHTLTELSVSVPLDDDLIMLLLDKAPKLSKVSCGGVDASKSYAHRQWAVTTLVIDDFMSSRFEKLPTCSTGIVRLEWVKRRMRIDVSSNQGLDAELARRLPEWQFVSLEYIDVWAQHPFQGTLHQPTALKNVLRQLGSMQAPGAEIHLSMWTHTPETLDLIAAALPTLPGLKLGALDISSRVTDEMLGTLIQVAPALSSVKVRSLDFSTDQYKDAPWPWEELTIDYIDVPYLSLLPDPATKPGGGPVRIKFKGMDFECCERADVDRLKHFMRHVIWEPTHTPLLIDVRCQDRTEAHVLTQLSILKEMRLANPHTTEVHFSLRAGLTTRILEALRTCLPAWQGQVSFMQSLWRNKPSLYKRIADYIPTTYNHWLVDLDRDCSILRVLCESANKRRFGLGLKPLRISLWQYEASDSECEEVKVGRHVVVGPIPEDNEDGYM